jgi:hypothetical protein
MKYAVNIWHTGLTTTASHPDPQRWFKPLEDAKPSAKLADFLLSVRSEKKDIEVWAQLLTEDTQLIVGVLPSGVSAELLFPKVALGGVSEKFVMAVKDIGGKAYLRFYNRITGKVRMEPHSGGGLPVEKSDDEVFVGIFGILPQAVYSCDEERLGYIGWKGGSLGR